VNPLESARAVADAVLYEGYVLYPYRASAPKNQVRWQWGVLMPAAVEALDSSERSSSRTDVVLDGREPRLRLRVRFLQVQRRVVENAAGETVERLEAGDAVYVPWDEALEHEVEVPVPLADGLDVTLEIPGGDDVEDLPGRVGRLVRVREPLRLGVVVNSTRPRSPYPVVQAMVRIENRTPVADAADGDRPRWLRHALVACHCLLEAEGASFVSMLDPPEWAKGFVAQCVNEGVFPVLAGPSDQAGVMLSSPIILYDYPELAPQSESAFFDALEIDELLSLRTTTLSEEEKREARGTDPRVASLLREVDDMPSDLWERLHGMVRYLDAMTGVAPSPPSRPSDEPGRPDVADGPGALGVRGAPWWDPGSDSTVDPENDAVMIGAAEVRRGTRVVLRPGVRRADAYDMFLAGRTATVAAVLHDVDGNEHLAVTVDEDPGSDIKASHGRYLYFAPDEVEPLAGADR
jgi:hypothetical protein